MPLLYGVAFYLHLIHFRNMLSFHDCVKIGAFRKPHGVSGTLDLVFEPQWEASVINADIFITETDGLPVPWFVAPDGIRITSSQTALVDLDWINNQDSAKKLCGNSVYILKNKITLNENSSEISDWIGFSIYDAQGSQIGKITGIEDFAGNLVMVVDTPFGEKMVPLHADLIIEINPGLRRFTMEFPEGLLDI